MEESKKHELIEYCETIEDLKNAILIIGDITTRKGKVYSPVEMAFLIDLAYETGPISVLTREYGIRQQLLYIYYYEKMEKLIKSN